MASIKQYKRETETEKGGGGEKQRQRDQLYITLFPFFSVYLVNVHWVFSHV